MSIIFIYFWRLCLLRADPLQLPIRHVVFLSALCVYGLVALTAGLVNYPGRTVSQVVLVLVTGLTIQMLLLYGILVFKNVRQHFSQAMSALLGTSAVMTIIILPVNLILLRSDIEWLRVAADSMTWVWLAWWLLIGGNILAKVARLSLGQGAILIFLTELLSTLASLHWVEGL